MLIEIEKTPNPATRKFLPGRTVMEAGGRDFPNADAAEASPLAEALFATGMVDGVYFGRDFVSVSAAPDGRMGRSSSPRCCRSCSTISCSTRRCSGRARAAGIESRRTAPGFEDDPADADIIDQIKELLETRVRPAVAQDGGDIVYRGYKDGKLYLGMQGACSGCPSSTVTLKRGVESLIKHYVPEVETIEAV